VTCAQPLALRQVSSGRSSTPFRLLLCACLALSITGFTFPGRDPATDIGGVDSLAIAKIGLRGIAFLVLALLAFRLNFHRRATAVLGRLLPMGLFGLWTMTTVLWSPLKAMSFAHALEIVILTTVAVCAGLVIDSDTAVEKLCQWLFLFMAGACAFVMIVDTPLILAGERPYGYMHPNSLSALASMALVILLGARVLWGWAWSRRLLIPGIAVCTAAIFVARSRTGLLTTLFVVTVFLWRYSRRSLALLLLLVCGCLLALMPYVESLTHLDRGVGAYLLRGQTREDVMAGSGRDEVWKIALNSVREAPLFGHGYYSMSDTGRVFVWRKEQVQTAHDVYLHVLTGTGAIGLLLFLWGLATMMVPMVRAQARSWNPIAILALTLMVWQLIATLFEVGIVGPIDPVTVAFFVVGGAGVGATLNLPVRPEASPCVS
jgi:O-antigen ligase